MTTALIQHAEKVAKTVATHSCRPPLLFLSHRIPYPPDKGDKIRSFHLLRHLSKHFTIFLGAFIDDPRDWEAVDDLNKFCQATCLRPLVPGLARWKSLSGMISNKALTLPYYSDERMKRWVAETCATQNIRHALVYSAAMAQFLPGDGSSFERKIIDFVDVDATSTAKWKTPGVSSATVMR